MGQLIAKLMGVFGNQGKGRIAHSSDCFDSAPTRGSPNPGSGRMRWGTSGSEDPAWALLASSGAPFLAPSRLLPSCSSRVARFGAHRGAGLSEPPSSWLKGAAGCDRGSFSRPLLLASPGRPGPFGQPPFRKCGARKAQQSFPLSGSTACVGVGEETCPVGFWSGKQKWYSEQRSPSSLETLVSFLGTPVGHQVPLVTEFGPDPALPPRPPPDASRAQGYHRGTGQRGKDHHSLPVVSDSRVERGGGWLFPPD